MRAPPLNDNEWGNYKAIALSIVVLESHEKYRGGYYFGAHLTLVSIIYSIRKFVKFLLEMTLLVIFAAQSRHAKVIQNTTFTMVWRDLKPYCTVKACKSYTCVNH